MWGPELETRVNFVQPHLRDIPYAPFSKSSMLGRPADFEADIKKRPVVVDPAAPTSTFAYVHDNDDSFSVVDRIPAVPVVRVKAKAASGPSGVWGKTPTQPVQKRGQLSQQRGAQYKQKPAVKYFSLTLDPEWKLVEEYSLTSFAKLLFEPVEPKDIGAFGSVNCYDRQFDRASGKKSVPLKSTTRKFYNPSASQDEILSNIATSSKLPDGSTIDGDLVFASHKVLAALMTCQRSVIPWDVIVKRQTFNGNVHIWFDKRDNGCLDLLTVSETSDYVPQESDEWNNSAALALEATQLNQKFSQQALTASTIKIGKEIPARVAEGETPASQAFKYRMWKLRDDEKPITLIARTAIDAALPVTTDTNSFLTLNAFTEHFPVDPATGNLETSHVDWKSKIDHQRGAIIATEMRNNAWKLARWIIEALLSNADQMKLGFISRVIPATPTRGYVIIGTQLYKPNEFAAQCNLDLNNAWGILRGLVETFMNSEDGTYILTKDPAAPKVRLYRVPDGVKISGYDKEDEDEGDQEEAGEGK